MYRTTATFYTIQRAFMQSMHHFSILCLFLSALLYCPPTHAEFIHEIRDEYGYVVRTFRGDSQLDLDVQLQSWFSVTESVIQYASYTHLSTHTLTDQEIKSYIENIQDVALKYGHDDIPILQNLLDKIIPESAYHYNNRENPRDPRTTNAMLGHFASSLACLGVSLFTYYKWYKALAEERRTYPSVVEWKVLHPKYILRPLYLSYQPAFTKLYHSTARRDELDKKLLTTQAFLTGLGLVGATFGLLGCLKLKDFLLSDPKHQERYDQLVVVKEYLEEALAESKRLKAQEPDTENLE